jgi:hypothetical protein
MRVVRLALLLCGFSLAGCQTRPPHLPENTPPTVAGYKKAVEDRLGPLWYREVNRNINAAQVGVVKLTFLVPAEGGRVTNLKVLSNTGGKADEQFAVTAVNRLRVPPIPQVILTAEKTDHLFFEESFTVFADPSTPTPTPAPPKR